MILLERHIYKTNDCLEKMYPALKNIKLAAKRYMERVMQEDLLMRTYTEILKEVAEALYLDWTISTLGIAAVREVDFKDLSVSQQDPFIDCAKIIIKIVGEDTGKLVHPLRIEDRPRMPMPRFIRPVNGPISIVLKVGDSAVIQRGANSKC